jgi:hypothetical protein
MNSSNIKNIGALLLLSFGAVSSANAHEHGHDFLDLSLNLSGPAYYVEPEFYYDARPVYVEPPRVLYYDRPIVSYEHHDSQPYYYEDDYDEHEHRHGHGHAYGHYKHHHHDDDD